MTQSKQTDEEVKKEVLKYLKDLPCDDIDLTTKEGREAYARRIAGIQATVELQQRVLVKQGIDRAISDDSYKKYAWAVARPFEGGWEVGGLKVSGDDPFIFDIPIDGFPSSELLVEEERAKQTKIHARNTLLATLIHSLNAIVNPEDVLEVAEVTMKDFEPEEHEKGLYDLFCTLYEEAKEKMKHD
jgi:hypothetical protein